MRVAGWLLLALAALLGCGQTTQRGGEQLASDGAPSSPDAAMSAGNAASGAAGLSTSTSGSAAVAGADAGSGGETNAEPPHPGGAGGTPQDTTEAGAAPVGACPATVAHFASSVVDHAFGGSQNFNQTQFPAPLLGPPEANEPRSVISLGNGGFVVLAFEGNAIVDGPGADFTVFENPLPAYPELATVAVSDDGSTWSEFPCTAAHDGPDFGACAGVALVLTSSANGVDPLDPTASGGDQYDLADLGLLRARFVRITDRVDLDTEVFDLDAVAIVHAECP